MNFIEAGGNQFTLDGKPFRVAGANNYYLGFESDVMVAAVFELASRMALTVLRTGAFLDCGSAAPGTVPGNAKNGIYFQYLNSTSGRVEVNEGPDGWERLDRTIWLAERAGIRLILPLVNHWDDFGGMKQYLAWFGITDKRQFYINAQVRDTYRAYVERLLVRVNTRTGRQYRDEPAIFAWELANEPRCDGDDGSTIAVWADEMSTFIHTIDCNHLIGVGDEGYFRRRFAWGNRLYNGSMGVDCERLLALPAVDFGTCHLYPEYSPKEASEVFGARWIREHLEAARRASKPMLVEEYGAKAGSGRDERDSIFRNWLAAVEAGSGAGALLWMIAGADYLDYDGYTVYGPEEVPAVTAFARHGLNIGD